MLKFYRGATIPLEFSHERFPKSDWTAKLILSAPLGNAGVFEASKDSDDDRFKVIIAASQSAKIATGTYQVVCRYENAEGEVSFEQGCVVTFLPDPTSSDDQRSQLERDLDAVDKAIRQKIEGGAVDEYEVHTTVGQRRVRNMSLEELRNHRRWLIRQVNAERHAAGKKPFGNDQWKKIRAGLGNQSAVRRRRY